MNAPIINLADLLVPSTKTPIDQLFFNRRFQILYDALTSISGQLNDYLSIEDNLVQLGLDRLNEVLGPLLAKVQGASNLGFLVAEADGVSISLAEGAEVGFVVTAGGDLFAPTPYLLAVDKTDWTNWGMLSLGQWTAQTGDLATTCVYASKTKASTQWTLSASGGMLPVMQQMLDETVAAQSAATAAAATIASQLEAVAGYIAAIQSGPVASVAGKTGIITLDQTDIIGLVDALGAKAAASWVTSQLAGYQPSSAKLSALASLTLAANKLIYASSPSALGTADLSSFMIGLLSTADLATLQSTLGLVAEGGPVVSVAGRSGAVSLTTADIGGLAAALSAKQTLAANLTALAGLTLAADQLIYATSPSAVAVASLTSYMRGLLGTADLATLQSALGMGSAAGHAATDFQVAGSYQPAGNYLKYDTTALIAVGYTLTPYNNGIKSTGTFTPNPALGNYQYATNNGAHTLAAPTADCAIDILYTNGASAGALTLTGFTVGANVGDPFTTTNGHKFLISMLRINGTSTYSVKALQ